ncbi:MAG: hypothetical protein VKJ46_05715 [Leptolyngbyaceae bacterium]|nr:hypothetical protein [Leptolyngbyaceae bacterium]
MVTTARVNGREVVTRLSVQHLNTRSAEARAIIRLTDLRNPKKWITVVKIGQEIDAEAGLEYLENFGCKFIT